MMLDKRFYFDDYVSSIPKRNKSVCGDVFEIVRTSSHTLFILCDGIGSGIKANIAANMCCERIKDLSSGGLSLRKIFERLSYETEKAKKSDGLYCAFSAAVFFSDGKAISCVYEMPFPYMLEDGGKWFEIKYKSLGLFSEAEFNLRENDAVCFVSDGVTQSGMGTSGALNEKAVLELLNANIYKVPPAGMPAALVSKAKEISGDVDDDTTAALISCRQANSLCVFSGAPYSKNDDEKAVKKFLSFDGKKAVCGSTTTDIFCRVAQKEAKIDDAAFSGEFMPPEYEIDGLDFASEGVITLNQCFNILKDEYPLKSPPTPPVKLANLLLSSDIIHFIEGTAVNKGHDDIMFKQMGILPRKEIIYRISSILSERSKIVSKEEI